MERQLNGMQEPYGRVEREAAKRLIADNLQNIAMRRFDLATKQRSELTGADQSLHGMFNSSCLDTRHITSPRADAPKSPLGRPRVLRPRSPSGANLIGGVVEPTPVLKNEAAAIGLSTLQSASHNCTRSTPHRSGMAVKLGDSEWLQGLREPISPVTKKPSWRSPAALKKMRPARNNQCFVEGCTRCLNKR